MLDLFTIFTKGGIVLWYFQGTALSFTPAVNALIKSVILQVLYCNTQKRTTYCLMSLLSLVTLVGSSILAPLFCLCEKEHKVLNSVPPMSPASQFSLSCLCRSVGVPMHSTMEPSLSSSRWTMSTNLCLW